MNKAKKKILFAIAPPLSFCFLILLFISIIAAAFTSHDDTNEVYNAIEEYANITLRLDEIIDPLNLSIQRQNDSSDIVDKIEVYAFYMAFFDRMDNEFLNTFISCFYTTNDENKHNALSIDDIIQKIKETFDIVISKEIYQSKYDELYLLYKSLLVPPIDVDIIDNIDLCFGYSYKGDIESKSDGILLNKLVKNYIVVAPISGTVTDISEQSISIKSNRIIITLKNIDIDMISIDQYVYQNDIIGSLDSESQLYIEISSIGKAVNPMIYY